MALSEIILTIDNVELIEFYGQNDSKLNLVKKVFSDVNILPRGNQIKLTGEKKRVQECKSNLEMMVKMLQEFKELNLQAVQNLLNGENPFESKLKIDSKNRPQTSLKTAGQKQTSLKTDGQTDLTENRWTNRPH